MNLNSKDIRKRDFKKTLRGYDPNEVDAFLETISSHYEKLLLENKNQAEKIKSLLADIDIYKENEINLQKAIIKAQDLAEEIIKNAKKKAEIIIRENELDIRRMRQNLDEEILIKKQEFEELKQKNEKIFEDIRNFLGDKLAELEDFFRNRKILKLELARNIDFDSEVKIDRQPDDEIIDAHEDKIDNDSKISSLKNNSGANSFDDSFEVKN